MRHGRRLSLGFTISAIGTKPTSCRTPRHIPLREADAGHFVSFRARTKMKAGRRHSRS